MNNTQNPQIARTYMHYGVAVCELEAPFQETDRYNGKPLQVTEYTMWAEGEFYAGGNKFRVNGETMNRHFHTLMVTTFPANVKEALVSCWTENN